MSKKTSSGPARKRVPRPVRVVNKPKAKRPAMKPVRPKTVRRVGVAVGGAPRRIPAVSGPMTMPLRVRHVLAVTANVDSSDTMVRTVITPSLFLQDVQMSHLFRKRTLRDARVSFLSARNLAHDGNLAVYLDLADAGAFEPAMSFQSLLTSSSPYVKVGPIYSTAGFHDVSIRSKLDPALRLPAPTQENEFSPAAELSVVWATSGYTGGTGPTENIGYVVVELDLLYTDPTVAAADVVSMVPAVPFTTRSGPDGVLRTPPGPVGSAAPAAPSARLVQGLAAPH